MKRLLVLLAIGAVLGCTSKNDPPQPPVDPVFPADWAKSYTQVRECRKSIDHDVRYVTIFADPTSLSSYKNHDKLFPAGSIILKVEYQDDKCASAFRGYTVMRREKGYSPGNGDWHWQKTDAASKVLEDGLPYRCVGCHRDNCMVKPPDGWDWTCSALIAN